MLIAIGTKNAAKIQGFTTIIKKVWKNSEFIAVETVSKISKQPLTIEEVITGAVNRANYALSLVKTAEYAAGIEGGVFRNNYGMFLGGWVALLRKNGELGIGSSAFVEVPKDLAYRLENGEEMGPITQELFNDDKNKIRHSNGTSGILTNNLYTRFREFEDATRCALAKFVAPEYYTEDIFKKK
jgi:inosine/xanthosine triphosphatase